MVGQHCVCKFGMCNILFAAVPEIDQLETGSSPAPGRHQGCHNPRLWSRRLCNLSTLSTVCVSRTLSHAMTHVNIANADVLIPKCDLPCMSSLQILQILQMNCGRSAAVSPTTNSLLRLWPGFRPDGGARLESHFMHFTIRIFGVMNEANI